VAGKVAEARTKLVFLRAPWLIQEPHDPNLA
jgi:hypothetical protein